MAPLVHLAVLVFLCTGLESLEISESADVLHACVGRDVTLPITVQQEDQDVIHAMEWFFDGSTQEMVAFLSHGIFLPLPAFSQRVERDSSGRLILRNTTRDDSGNYTLEVNGVDASGQGVTLRHSMYVEVAENLMASDRVFQVTQWSRAVHNDVTREWSLHLSCGNFTYPGQPPLAVEWMSPSGSVYNSSSYGGGQFHWLVPNPVEAGSYKCHVPRRYDNVLCVAPGSSQGPQAYVTVDDVRVRLMLMEAEQSSLRGEVAQLTANNTQLTANNTQLTNNVAQLTADNRQLTTDSQWLKQNVSYLQVQVDQLRLQSNDLRQHQVSFHAELSSNQHLQHAETLVMAKVISNQGNAYSNATGMFTAPYNGTYFVIATAGSTSSSYDAQVQLVVDGIRVGLAFAHRPASSNEMATCHAVIQLTAGQSVWLQSEGEAYFNGADTYFSGFLVSS